ncbi:MAG: FAD-dependent oxidoreductase [Candidatus Heimdallarchaeota archaeon]
MQEMIEVDADYLIIGAGPGGTALAERLSLLGADNVTVVEKGLIGGICVNQGCIPIHFALNNLILKHQISERIRRNKMFDQVPAVAIPQLKSAMEGIERKIRSGIKKNLEDRGIKFIEGTAKVLTRNEVEITKNDRVIFKLFVRNIIVAAGAVYAPISVPGTKEVEKFIIPAEQVMTMNLDEIPSEVIVFGADSPCIEIAVFFHLLGSEVTIASPNNTVVSYGSKKLKQSVEDLLEVEGIIIYKNTKIERFFVHDTGFKVDILYRDNKRKQLSSEMFINAFQKQPNLEWREKSNFGNPPDNIYFIGDQIRNDGLPFRSFLSTYEGRILADHIMESDHSIHVDPDLVLCGLTALDIEAAKIGLTQDEALNRGIKVKILEIPNGQNAYAQISGGINGYTMLIVEDSTERIIGGEIVGIDALNLITVIGTAIACNGTLKELRKFPAFHPSLAEGIFDCAWIK